VVIATSGVEMQPRGCTAGYIGVGSGCRRVEWRYQKGLCLVGGCGSELDLLFISTCMASGESID
jgi:hypothetical protein